MLLLDFLTIVLAALSLHHIWNYEVSWAQRIKLKPLSCSACNAFWIAALITVLWMVTPLVVLGIAGYAPVRILAWIYQQVPKWTAPKVVTAPPMKQPPPARQPAPVQKPAPPARIVASTRSYKHRVVILTSLADFRHSYSVAQETLNTARAIALKNPDWQVQVWALTSCDPAGWVHMPENTELRRNVPVFTWEMDKVNQDHAVALAKFLTSELKPMGRVDVITEDLLFISWFVSFAQAIHMVGDMPGVRWFHVCHSLPSNREGIPPVRCTVPAGDHTIITPSATAVDGFTAYYRTSKVRCVPNTRDPRTLGMHLSAQKLATHLRLWEADVVQIFPVCSTRLMAKGFMSVAHVFAALQKHMTVRLAVCNPNASGTNTEIARAKEVAKQAGLWPENWAFLSEVAPEAATHGLGTTEIMKLMNAYGNVLVLPSISEADSLIVLEAIAARQKTVLNASVPSMAGVGDVSVMFGTNPNEVNASMIDYAANRIMDELSSDLTEQRRRSMLCMRNLEGIGNQWSILLSPAGP